MQETNGTLFGLNAAVALWIAGILAFTLVSLAVYDSFRQRRRSGRYKARPGRNGSAGFFSNATKELRTLRDSLSAESNRRQREEARERERLK